MLDPELPLMLAAAEEIRSGTSLGKYEILRKLATGGMAEIYLARVRGTAGFEKLVVLKRILPQVADDPSFVQMFLDEARLAATLTHPNIADVYDVGEVDGQYFFTMAYIHGQDARTIRIASFKRDERVPLQVALAIVHDTAAALGYAHNKRGPDGVPLQLVHRDVSSSNVLVSYDGAIKLVDFGIARATSRQAQTQIGTLKGKIPYMSPEQCRGGTLDRRSDLWSLGVVLYELTTTRRPFRGDNDFMVMEQIVYGGAPPPTSLHPDYPRDLEAIVMRLLARDPSARYQTADQLVDALEAFQAAQGLHATSKAISKYMRALFGDKADAWKRAETEVGAIDAIMATTITSESQAASMRTPQSSITALPPADFARYERQSTPVAAQQVPPEMHEVSELAPRRRWPVISAVAGAVVAIGLVGWMVMHGGSGDAAATTTTTTTTTTASESPTPTPTPTPTPPTTPTTTTATAKKPVTKPVVKPVVKPTKKDQSWDPNSPFLPP